MTSLFKQKSIFVGCGMALAIAFAATPMLAQGAVKSSTGGTSSNIPGSGDQLQERDRDRVQDPTTHDGDEPLQDRTQLQDRDQFRDPSLHVGDTPIQDRDQLRDRLRDQLTTPVQEREQDRIRANNSDGLEELIVTGTEVNNDVTNTLDTPIRELEQNRNRVRLGVAALIAAQPVIGQYGQQVADAAQEISNAHTVMVQAEDQIRTRSWIMNMLFGGDKESAQTIQTQLQQNEQLIQQIRQYLNETTNQAVRAMLETQLQNMEAEHLRLQQLADHETTQWGLLSWRI